MLHGKKMFWAVLAIFILAFLPACGGGGGGDKDPSTNSDPIAAAGINQNVLTGSTVTLDGSGSHDPDGDLLSYLWSFTSKPQGSLATLSDDKSVNPTFIADLDGEYILQLTVDDGTMAVLSNPVVIAATPTLAIPTVTSLTGRVWMDRNLGASRVATAFDDSAAYGDLYQWGRGTDGHEKRDSPTTTTLSSSDTPGHGDFIVAVDGHFDWRNPQNDSLWQGGVDDNNPCPSGFRLPTSFEWGEEISTWSAYNRDGAFDSPLKLVTAGYRYLDGAISDAGNIGYYWSSSVDRALARYKSFNNLTFNRNPIFRAVTLSVRCIKD